MAVSKGKRIAVVDYYVQAEKPEVILEAVEAGVDVDADGKRDA